MYDPIGNLIADKQKEIQKINLNVYGKIKSIVRMASSLKKNLIFDYDANGNRIAKHQYGNMTPNSTQTNFDPSNPTDWEKSTYYTRDAQGNVMAIYEYTIDDATQQNHYTLTERNIYGSSRLGNNNAPVEMIAAPPTNTSQYSHHIGYRQYELSNHLGNVLAVISDRKIARDTDQDNTVDYYEPDVLLTYDYSPFGAPLHARSFTKEVCDEVTSTQKIEDLNTYFDDDFTPQGWQPLSGTTQRDASSGRLEVYKQGGGAGQLGVQQSITATSGFVYDFTITIENGFTSNATIVLELIDPNNTVIYTQSVGNGSSNTFTHQFTASATGTYVVKVYRTGNQASGSFFIDNALITHEEEVTQTVCEDFAGYRYGFNGKEMDNEVSGNGNSYDYGFRIYNPRIGRFLSVDPLFDGFPWWTPYQFSGNNPIRYIDLDGLEKEDPQEAPEEEINYDEFIEGVEKQFPDISNPKPEENKPDKPNEEPSLPSPEENPLNEEFGLEFNEFIVKPIEKEPLLDAFDFNSAESQEVQKHIAKEQFDIQIKSSKTGRIAIVTKVGYRVKTEKTVKDETTKQFKTVHHTTKVKVFETPYNTPDPGERAVNPGVDGLIEIKKGDKTLEIGIEIVVIPFI